MKESQTTACANSKMETTRLRIPLLGLIGFIAILAVGSAIFLTNQHKTTPLDQGQEPASAALRSRASAADEVVETTGAIAAPSTTTQMVVPRKARAGETAASGSQP